MAKKEMSEHAVACCMYVYIYTASSELCYEPQQKDEEGIPPSVVHVWVRIIAHCRAIGVSHEGFQPTQTLTSDKIHPLSRLTIDLVPTFLEDS